MLKKSICVLIILSMFVMAVPVFGTGSNITTEGNFNEGGGINSACKDYYGTSLYSTCVKLYSDAYEKAYNEAYEKARNEAYEKAYKEAESAADWQAYQDIIKTFDADYQAGKNNAQKRYSDGAVAADSDYQEGWNEAWQANRKNGLVPGYNFGFSQGLKNRQGACFLTNIIGQGNNLNVGVDNGLGSYMSGFLTKNIAPMLTAIGNLVFAGITVILGVKYIWSSAQGKADVLESLPTFVVAVVFFYLAGSLVNFFLGATSGVAGAESWEALAGNVIWIINTIVKYLALGGLVFMGVKYMLASAEGRASMKASMGGMVIGVLFVFLASNVVSFIIRVAEDVI